MKNIFGGFVEIEDKEDLDKFVQDLNFEKAVLMLETGITYALKSGVYDLREAHILYKCLSKIKENETEVQS